MDERMTCSFNEGKDPYFPVLVGPGFHKPSPDPWKEVRSESTGETYYWNQQTGEKTWTRPADHRPDLLLDQAHVHQGKAENRTQGPGSGCSKDCNDPYTCRDRGDGKKCYIQAGASDEGRPEWCVIPGKASSGRCLAAKFKEACDYDWECSTFDW